MRQLLLPFYGPSAVAPERAPLTILHAALRVAAQALRDAHPTLDALPDVDVHSPITVEAAALIVSRTDELLRLLDLYDRTVDHAVPLHDDHIPF